MALIADVTIKTELGDMTIPNAYISPVLGAHNGKDQAGWYTLTCWRTRGGVQIPVPQYQAGFLFTDPTLPEGYPARQPGVVYDRAKPVHTNIYADLAIKIAAGKAPWLTNVRNEDGSPFVDGAALAPAPPAEPAPAPALEHAFADLMLADETIDDAKARLSQRLRELRHYLIAPEIRVNEDGSLGLTSAEQAELQDLERRQTLGRWLEA